MKEKHDFLSEELLVPNCNKSDTMRLNMFNNHLSQSLVLDNPDFPYIFTNFESQIGDYSSSYLKAENDLEVFYVVEKNKFHKVLITYDKEKNLFDLIEMKTAINITENYGYKMLFSDIKPNTIIKKDSYIMRSTSYDEEKNFSYGKNLKTVYLSYKESNYEDAIVVSESASNKMVANFVNQVEININPNDLPLNLYGDENFYKSFPNIGEESNILIALRRFKNDLMLYELKNENLFEINKNTDNVYLGKGKVVDVEIFNNFKETELVDSYFQQIRDYLSLQKIFYSDIKEKIDKLFSKYSKSNFSDNLLFFYSRIDGYLGNKKWFKRNEFSGMIIKFTLLEKNNLKIGDKITNRYGGKGVISKILPDNEMPKTEEGEIADVILSPLGVINRTNIAQLIEVHLNFYSYEILKKIKTFLETEDYSSAYKIYMKYLKIVSIKQYEFLKKKFERKDKNSYIKSYLRELTKKNNLYIYQAPFYGNVSLDELILLQESFKDIVPYKFENIENPLIMGDMYFLKLKHYAFSKFSARSAGNLNLKMVPSKDTNFKNKLISYSKTPIRLGEMELFNMLILINKDSKEQKRIFKKFVNIYGLSTINRRDAINFLLKEKFDKNIEVNLKDNNIQIILNELLKVIGVKLKNEV